MEGRGRVGLKRGQTRGSEKKNRYKVEGHTQKEA